MAFGLSIVLTRTDNVDAAADLIAKDFRTVIDTHDFRQSVEAFAVRTLDTKGFDVRGFSVLMSCVDLSFDELYRRYIGKNVLNFFRQDNGYQDGSYRKLWQGREDNEHLVEIVDALDAADADFKDKVYAALKERYMLNE